MTKTMTKYSKDLLSIFYSALDAVSGKRLVEKEFSENNYPGTFHIIAIGKAADAMLQGVPPARIISALLISKHGHISQATKEDGRIRWLESDHPVPNTNSLKAGASLLDYLQKLPADEPCVFLISGGASALVEVLQVGWSLADLKKLTDYLLANAYPINEINAIRQRISKIKGGGLWSYLGERPVSCLMISDVPDDNPAIIGSGLLFPPAKENKDTPPVFYTFSDALMDMPTLPEAKVCYQPDYFKWKIIASLSDAKKAAAKKAEQLDYVVKIMPAFLQGDASDVAIACVDALNISPNTLFIWGGETTVQLPQNAGQGGRNQHLALAAAIQMTGIKNAYLLAAGTDGSDGMTTATGAIVNGETLEKGEALGLNASDYLQRADSNSYFKKTDELIITGATGTNVMDLVLGYLSA
jgi:hydroxypyruvate reductase